MNKELYIGIMSGTSLDGVDITLCEIDELSCRLVSSAEYPFPLGLKAEILHLLSTSTTLQEIGELDNKLGTLFGELVVRFVSEQKLHDNIRAIGLHGQTLWHSPDSENPFSMQLGDANIVAAKTGITTVADFRRMDMANGGQGAPFAPAFHQFLFGGMKENVAVVNIGGMANITLLGKNLKGWDSGCGNVLLDMWINQTQEKPYDKDGDFARRGTIDEDLLENMLNDSYFKKPAPKSTGREYFNENWLANFLPIFHTIKDEDIQRTLLELTAKSISNDLQGDSITKLIVCGGGSKNRFLMQRLSELCECEVSVSDEFGVSSDFLESMAFAWLAKKRIHREVVELSCVTGARKDSILGGVYG